MKYFCVLLLLSGGARAAGQIVESVSLTGAQNYNLSQDLLQQIQRLNGRRYDQASLDELSKAVGNELSDCSVSQRVVPGEQADHVKVVFEVTPRTGGPASVEPETNVNSRYTVEDVEVKGADKKKLSKPITEDIQQLIGKKFSQEAFDDLAGRIRRELHAHAVSHRLVRGEKPEQVKVVLEVNPERENVHEVNLSKFLYDSKQGWSAKAVGDFEIAPDTSVILGLISDGDDLLERYAGLVAGFGSKKVVTDRLRLRFLFETYHHQWNRATLAALEAPADGNLDASGIYRTRKNFQPMITVLVAKPLAITAGTSFEFIQTQFPTSRTEAANAAVGGVHYLQHFGSTADIRHEIEAGYDIRAATRTFDSDFAYTRHQWNFGYKISGPRQAVLTRLTAGRLSGRAPLFDRFLLGNSTMLRGWDKFEVAPLGGARMVHNSLEYHHAVRGEEDEPEFVVFYDTGTVWDRGQRASVKHAVGAAIRWGLNVFLGVGFPLKAGRMEPIFMAGAKF